MSLRSRWAGMAVIVATAAAIALALGAPASASAQVAVAAPVTGPMVGSVAPDFSLPGATRYGLLKGPIHLADHRGETVVLAFFYQARTKG